LSSQTTDTFEYFSTQLAIQSANLFVPHFFAAMFIAYFIHIHFANPGYFPDIHFRKTNPPSTIESFSSFSALNMKNCFSVKGVCHHSAAATQKTLHAPPRPCKSAAEERAMQGSWC
jgi:hypothetical protein